MSVHYHTTDVWGVTEVQPDRSTMLEVLQTLEDADVSEFGDVSLVHESGWTLSWSESGVLVWENLNEPESGYPAHRLERSRDRVLELWQTLARGEIRKIQALDWNAEDA